MDLLLSTKKKEFYIDLLESRYYFPGDLIKGDIVLDLDKPTKTNHIRVTLEGHVQADNTTIQVLTKSWFLASSPLNDGKPHMLEAQAHRFPFEFKIPTDESKLPSSLKLSSLIGVNYTITAIHDRPYVPDRLSSQTKKEIRLLEFIDITQPEYCAKGHVYDSVRVLGLSDHQKVQLSLTLPRYAVVRGDILPLEITIKHFQELVRENGIKVYLIRRVFSGKNKNKLLERKSIKSNALDINITSESTEYQQIINTKLLIPTNTPPTVSESGHILKVDYSIRVVINLNDPSLSEPHHENYTKLESSIIIGTHPKPNLSIDDDDEEEEEDETNMEDVDGLHEEQDIATQDETDSINIQQLTLADNDNVSKLDKPLPSLTSSPTTSVSTTSASTLQIYEPKKSTSYVTGTSSFSLLVVDPTTLSSTQHQHRSSSTTYTPVSLSPSTSTTTTTQQHHDLRQSVSRQSSGTSISSSVHKQHVSRQSSSASIISNNNNNNTTIIDPTTRHNSINTMTSSVSSTTSEATLIEPNHYPMPSMSTSNSTTSSGPGGFAMPMPMTMPDHTLHQPYQQQSSYPSSNDNSNNNYYAAQQQGSYYYPPPSAPWS
ncbi:uncharacterized protein BX664DRAFT_332270 [Halteromyces radiatus]|uniref:uncharacterized protein n=1 Tax=Halteromyces radiatus TaxID=101107 RepID=UPI00221E521A|nr:uncharacterized protein BX664DRAFT_332270 [Halteromyces radiatus]KAI8089136.1 hypothetical protein BX664DRAFT_332270 [Halteromyces radiatus]